MISGTQIVLDQAPRDKMPFVLFKSSDNGPSIEKRTKKIWQKKSTTRPDHLLKRQIAVRAYSDWNEARPGFLEIDLVAHGGETASGQFLNTLTITDIASTWTECFGLISKSEVAVVEALTSAQGQLPFQILGIESDNGSEFINHGLLD